MPAQEAHFWNPLKTLDLLKFIKANPRYHQAFFSNSGNSTWRIKREACIEFLKDNHAWLDRAARKGWIFENEDMEWAPTEAWTIDVPNPPHLKIERLKEKFKDGSMHSEGGIDPLWSTLTDAPNTSWNNLMTRYPFYFILKELIETQADFSDNTHHPTTLKEDKSQTNQTLAVNTLIPYPSPAQSAFTSDRIPSLPPVPSYSSRDPRLRILKILNDDCASGLPFKRERSAPPGRLAPESVSQGQITTYGSGDSGIVKSAIGKPDQLQAGDRVKLVVANINQLPHPGPSPATSQFAPAAETLSFKPALRTTVTQTGCHSSVMLPYHPENGRLEDYLSSLVLSTEERVLLQSARTDVWEGMVWRMIKAKRILDFYQSEASLQLGLDLSRWKIYLLDIRDKQLRNQSDWICDVVRLHKGACRYDRQHWRPNAEYQFKVALHASSPYDDEYTRRCRGMTVDPLQLAIRIDDAYRQLLSDTRNQSDTALRGDMSKRRRLSGFP